MMTVRPRGAHRSQASTASKLHAEATSDMPTQLHIAGQDSNLGPADHEQCEPVPDSSDQIQDVRRPGSPAETRLRHLGLLSCHAAGKNLRTGNVPPVMTRRQRRSADGQCATSSTEELVQIYERTKTIAVVGASANEAKRVRQ
jgi:hypothetical protein